MIGIFQAIGAVKSAQSAKDSAEIAKGALDSQRAVVYLGGPHFDNGAKIIVFPIMNSGHINSGEADITSYEFTWLTQKNGVGIAEGHWRQSSIPSIPVGDGSTIPMVDPGETYYDVGALREGRSGYIIGFDISYDDGLDKRQTWSTVLCSYIRHENNSITLGPCPQPDALADLKKRVKYPDPSTRR